MPDSLVNRQNVNFHTWQSVAIAFVAVGLATALRAWPLQALGSSLTWLTFYPAVMFVAVYCGFVAGFLSTLLACLTVVYLWPIFVAQPFINHTADWLGMAVFILTCLMICGVAEAMRRANRRAEKALTEAEIAKALMAESIQNATQRDLNCHFANKPYLECFGRRPEEIIGMNMRDLHGDQLFAQNKRYIEVALAGQAQQFERTLVKADGSMVHTWVHYVPDISAQGGVKGLFVLVSDVTQQKEAQSALQQSEEKLRAIVDNVGTVFFLKNLAGRYLYINRQYERLFHVTNSEIQGKTDHDIFPPDLADAFVKNDQRVVQSGQSVEVEELALQDDCIHTYSSVKIPIRNSSGEIYAVCGVATDITERKRAETDLRLAAAAFDSQEAMMVTDANAVILRVNRAFTEITGYAVDELVGQTPRLLKSGRHNIDFYRAMWASINSTGGWQGEVWDRRKNGEEYPKWLTISAVKGVDGAVTHLIGTHLDISERKKAEEKINELAYFDQLTNLANRTLLMDRLKQAMTASSRNGCHGALMFIDLDNFKTLNDTLGHDMGDLLLKQAAQRLMDCVRDGDTVARLGGDEFVVMLTNLSASESEAAIGIEAIADKILSTLDETYQLKHLGFHNTASIGITLFQGQSTSIDDLMKQADLAMYKAKEAGRNAYRFFDPHMESTVKERAALENDLRQAINEKQFLLYYQAQVVGDGLVTGAEVLVRWQHPQRGMISPAEFIPLAEETGLILALGHWVLETACVRLAQWATDPVMAELTIAVNVSAHQFRQPDFVDGILKVLKKTGVNPYRFKLELTESLLVDNVQDIIEKMHALKAKGVGFSLDDFGTGYSSLSYLKRLPLDQLKIDRSFVCDVLTDPNDAVIAKTVVALAQSFGLSVIAEGVETVAQRDFLASSGCHSYQGYFFSRPLPVEGFEEYVRRT
ncbi:MAG: PAS/PAC and Chase sensor-containing diguanylate cyclase/phosphodiesterase [Comamonadaceae bacterium]|nr:MAG: PAS/PAC and Chase sensor-containing diguanylate cyclase/phosphodiesterase [Comamonadaceae bacterium]